MSKPNITETDIITWVKAKGEELGVNLGITDGEYPFNARSGGVTGVGKSIAAAIENMNAYREKTKAILRQQLAELDA